MRRSHDLQMGSVQFNTCSYMTVVRLNELEAKLQAQQQIPSISFVCWETFPLPQWMLRVTSHCLRVLGLSPKFHVRFVKLFGVYSGVIISLVYIYIYSKHLHSWRIGTFQASMFLMFSLRHVNGNLRTHLK